MLNKVNHPFEKSCSSCKLKKSTNCFGANSSKKDGLQDTCKECRQLYRDNNKTKIKAAKFKYYHANKDILIVKTKEWYEANKEAVLARHKDYYLENKELILAKNKKWQEVNRDSYLESMKNWYQNNKEISLQRSSEFRKNNKELVNKSARDRKANDEIHAFKCRVRSSLSNSFKRACNGKYTKSNTTEDILACDLNFFMGYIESQFENWMSFENYGKCESNDYKCSWTFDHVIPLEIAKTEKDIIVLNHWSNFQPMCSKKNLEKNKYIFPVTNLELKLTVE